MYTYYALTAFIILFGAPKVPSLLWSSTPSSSRETNGPNNIKQLPDPQTRSFDSYLIEKGRFCPLFEARAQTLCSTFSNHSKLELSLLMANCELETFNEKPLKVAQVSDMPNAGSIDRMITMQMLSRLPLFCSSLASHGLLVGFENSHTFRVMNHTARLLEQVLVADEKGRSKFKTKQDSLIPIHQKFFKQSIDLALLVDKITKIGSSELKEGLDRVLQEMQDIDPAFSVTLNGEKRALVLINKGPLILPKTGYMREGELATQLMKHRIFLAFLCALLILSRTSLAPCSAISFCVVTMLFLFISAVTKFSTTSPNIPILNFFSFIFEPRSSFPYVSFFAISAQVFLIMYFAYPKIIQRLHQISTTTAHTERLPSGVDIHNNQEVLRYLDHQEQEISEIVRTMQKVSDINAAQQEAFSGDVFVKSKSRRRSVANGGSSSTKVSGNARVVRSKSTKITKSSKSIGHPRSSQELKVRRNSRLGKSKKSIRGDL